MIDLFFSVDISVEPKGAYDCLKFSSEKMKVFDSVK